MKQQRQGKFGVKVEAAEQVGGTKSGLAARQSSHRGVESPEKPRAPHLVVRAGAVEAGRMQNLHRVEDRWIRQYKHRWIRNTGSKRLEIVLVAFQSRAPGKPLNGLHQKNLGFD